jgi:hypothetical protein
MASKILENIIIFLILKNIIILILINIISFCHNYYLNYNFNPTPKLKSSPVPILFISFDENKLRCDYCKNEYFMSDFYQKYCKNCFMKYLEDNDADKFLDASYIGHERTDIEDNVYFNQVISVDFCEKIVKEFCELCKKSIYKLNNFKFNLCSDCYRISSGWVKSTSPIPILSLPWWDAKSRCGICSRTLIFESDCQKWCSYCFIVYVGCRYCLTTNIIFGIAEQSQCKKCKRISLITIEMIKIKKKFLKINTKSYKLISNYMNTNYSDPLEVYKFINNLDLFPLKLLVDWNSSLLKDNENSFNSNIPIMFIPFSNNEEACLFCDGKYSITYLLGQKYCEHCLFLHINFINFVANNIKYTIDDMYLSIEITENVGNLCERKANICTQNIRELCKNYSNILFFDKIINSNNNRFNMSDYVKEKIIEGRKDCKSCGKLIYEQTSIDFELKLCSNCYQISFEYVESALIEKTILILYLPWWDTYNQCIVCNHDLIIGFKCQKWCPNCFIIYIGCRYCLTTNIIFGYTNRSKCKKCKRIITIIEISGNHNIDKFLYFININSNNDNYYEIANYINNTNKNSNQLNIYNHSFIQDKFTLKSKLKWFSYSQIKNLEQIAEGGFGIIYKASNNGNIVAIKKVLNSQDPSKQFLNEVIFNFKIYLLILRLFILILNYLIVKITL